LKGYKKKYAKEKLFIEKKFKDLATKNYNVSIARCFTFIGKNILRYNYAISDLINAANNKNNITLKTSQIDVFRSYMHSDDLSNWLITILKNSNTKCPIYNVGSDKVINLKNLTKKIGIMTNKKISIKIKKSNKFDYYIPSVLKAKKQLNLKNSISLKDALSSTIKSL
jgi:nucleoside-diphosphate-sugar epimerase